MEDMHVLGEDSSLLSYNTLSCFISNTSKHAFIPIHGAGTFYISTYTIHAGNTKYRINSFIFYSQICA